MFHECKNCGELCFNRDKLCPDCQPLIQVKVKEVQREYLPIFDSKGYLVAEIEI